MDLPKENRNGTNIENLEHYSQYMCINDNGSNVNSNKKCFYAKTDADEFKNNDNKTDCSSKLDSKHTFVILPNQYNNTYCESRNACSKDSFESVYSRNLQTESNYRYDSHDKCKSEIKVNRNDYDNRENYDSYILSNPDGASEDLEQRIYQKLCSDKTTYCRPVLNLYNQEFLYRTMQKNAKLQRIVTQLAVARQKEKEGVQWKNYINDLKRKHYRDLNQKCGTSIQYISNEVETSNAIEDLYNTKFAYKQSDPCQHLLKNFYTTHDIRPNNYDQYNKGIRMKLTSNEYNIQTQGVQNPFKTNSLCFPTSAQGRLTILERERLKRLKNEGYKRCHTTINEEQSPERFKTTNLKEIGPKKYSFVRNSRSSNTPLQCTSTQTKCPITPLKAVNELVTKGCNTYHVLSEEKCFKEVRDKGTEPAISYVTGSNLRKNSLVYIEEKLDTLIYAVNNFITEMKTKSAQRKHFDQYVKVGDKNVNYTRSEICNMARKKKFVYGYIDDSSRTTRNSSIDNFYRTKDDHLTNILWKNNDKRYNANNLIDSSVKEPHHPCSVQISVTIPTKETSTEVTRSLSKAGNLETRNILIEEIAGREDRRENKNRREDRRIAIAVNTDPLSLLAMLRVSTEETVKRLLSYVPTIDYYSYLSKLQGPPTTGIQSQYVCNICGAAFLKASALTDHIRNHDLRGTRDCCVCRHVLDVPRRRPGLFKCQYCRKRFTRAYCCELHQEACARRVGKLHDVSSSLVLLR